MNDFVASLDHYLAVLPPLARVMLWAALSSMISMALYAKLSPQQKLIALKSRQRDARAQLRRYDGEWAGLQALIKQDLGLSLLQVAVITLPFLISVAPIVYLFTVLPALYPMPLAEAGPDWMRGFEFWYFATLLLCSLAIKIKYKIV